MTAEPTDSEHPFADVAPVSAAIMRLAHEQRAAAGDRLAALGLFPGQELVLAQLWASDGRSQKELVDSLRLDHSTIAKSVQRLERAGLVDRARSSEDGRIVLVTPHRCRARARAAGARDLVRPRGALGRSAQPRRARSVH